LQQKNTKIINNNNSKFAAGQRWISELELNLGLGIVKSISDRRVEIHYPASDCLRLYAISSAPLRRVIFKPGDNVESKDGLKFEIITVNETKQVFIYTGKDSLGKKISLRESELKDSLNFTTPEDRFNSKLFENTLDFNLRYRALLFQNEIRKSSIRGFMGGRIDLIAHQLYIAHEVSARYNPRVLLGDETGLGKTIEACLIIHRLLLNEQIKRVLILVPESLVHQWFVELLRKFNLIFKIIDKSYIESLSFSNYTGNLFLENQLCLCNLDLFTSENVLKTSSQDTLQNLAINADWDMIVIDEAHHLIEGSPEYLLVKNLGQKSKSLLLLTATPEQFGFKSHFERLHLLDPSRYFNYELFRNEEEQYIKIAHILDKVKKNKLLTISETDILKLHLIEYSKNSPEQMMEELLDRLGTGRAVFQNSRSIMKDFPERKVYLTAINTSEEDLIHQTLEFNAILKSMPEFDENFFQFKNDARIQWLATLIKTSEQKKILVICSSKEKAKAVEQSLRNILNIEIVLFHEELSLLQRDKNASRFAYNDGAQILICSEIGSEGRNFQFAHNMVLFDLPVNPELLEQRIGRLDRIGQKETIHIHVPFFKGSEYEILARWYHEGLNAFVQNIPGVHLIFETMKDNLLNIISNKSFHELNELISKTKLYCAETAKKFSKGKDHLLELNSFRPEIAQKLITQIQNVDHSNETEEMMLDIFESFGIEEDLISDKTYKLNLSFLNSDDFPLPVLRKDDLVITFDRTTAVSHEHMEFISRDHPLVSSSIEFLLTSEKGNCSLAILQSDQKQKILLETIYVLECVAPQGLHLDRFLPPTPIRVIVNHLMEDCGNIYTHEFLSTHLKNTERAKILDNPQFKGELFPNMVKKCETIANASGNKIRNNAIHQMDTSMTIEINRLKNLQKINVNIESKQIDDYKDEQKLLGNIIENSRVRLDSLRLILSKDLG